MPAQGGVHIGLSGSQSGVKYSLYAAATLSGSVVSGNGSAFDFGLRTAAADYTVVAKDTTTSCMRNMGGTAYVTITPLVFPSVSISSDKGTQFCKGDLLTFTASSVHGGTLPRYEWLLNSVNTGVVANEYHVIPNNGDVVAVNMVSNENCASAYVAGASVVLMEDTLLNPSATVIVNPFSGSSSPQQVTLGVVANGVGANTTYQWVRNTIALAGATNATYTGMLYDNDSLTCIVATGNICKDFIIAPFTRIHIGNVGVSSVREGGNIALVPNPNSGTFIIRGEVSTSENAVDLTIVNMLGQEVYRESAAITNGQINETVALDGKLSSGFYLLHIRSAKLTKTMQIVLER